MRAAAIVALMLVTTACGHNPPAPTPTTRPVIVYRDRWQPVIIIDNTKRKPERKYKAGYGPTTQVVIVGGKMTLTNQIQ